MRDLMMNGTGIRGIGRVGSLRLAVAVCLAALYLSCGEIDNSEQSIGARDVPDQEFTDFTTYESDSGVVQWILEAPIARIYNARKLLVTIQPHITFFNELGETTSVLTADKGEYQQVSHDLTALGNVVVTSRQGYMLETESLVWVNEMEEIHTEDFVRFIKENDILTGYGFRSDPELQNVTIHRDVEAFLRDDDGVVDGEVRKDRGGGGKHGE
ncbi:MAG TPA: LPS export ABC transporter periplasmic protein LptC [Patescibacteria group bacterium]|nr:LPS export ABC transporter periplasmic protein LptC [Patescibacteria group bacterium]